MSIIFHFNHLKKDFNPFRTRCYKLGLSLETNNFLNYFLEINCYFALINYFDYLFCWFRESSHPFAHWCLNLNYFEIHYCCIYLFGIFICSADLNCLFNWLHLFEQFSWSISRLQSFFYLPFFEVFLFFLYRFLNFASDFFKVEFLHCRSTCNPLNNLTVFPVIFYGRFYRNQ